MLLQARAAFYERIWNAGVTGAAVECSPGNLLFEDGVERALAAHGITDLSAYSPHGVADVEITPNIFVTFSSRVRVIQMATDLTPIIGMVDYAAIVLGSRRHGKISNLDGILRQDGAQARPQ